MKTGFKLWYCLETSRVNCLIDLMGTVVNLVFCSSSLRTEE